MILTAHQPLYLGGYLGTLAKIASADLFCLFDCVPMESSGNENRQRIKTQAGPQWLTVPVRRDRDVLLKDVAIANDGRWQRKHWRAIELAYQRAPFFEEYAGALRQFYTERWERLADLDRCMLEFFLRAFGIKTPIIAASERDFRGAKSALVLDMCRQLGADKYIFGPKGRDYADVATFERAGIEVEFRVFQHPTYPQLHGEFVPNMSSLDLLLNVGGTGISEWREMKWHEVIYERAP